MVASSPAVGQYYDQPEAIPVDTQPATLLRSAVVRSNEVDSNGMGEVVALSRDGRRALVIASDEGLNIWPALFSFWPEATVLALIIIGAILMRRASRLRRVPRGVPHCGACGYIIHDPVPRCPECGNMLSAKSLCYGRPAYVHLALVAFIVLLVVCVYPLFQRALPREADWVWERSHWYSAELLAKAEAHFPEWADEYDGWPDVLLEIDTATREVLQSLDTARWSLAGAVEAPNGSGRIALVSDGERIIVLERSGTEPARIVYRSPTATSPDLIGFSPDARRLYYYDMESSIRGVCALDLDTSQVTTLKGIPASGGGCFGPSGPYISKCPNSDLALVSDGGATFRGEPPLRLLDLTTGQWAATLDRTGDYWHMRFTTDGAAVLAIDWSPELPRSIDPAEYSLVTYWSVDRPESPDHVLLPLKALTDVIDIDAAGPRVWQVISRRGLESGEQLLRVQRMVVGDDGSVAVVAQHRLLTLPAECEGVSWDDVTLTRRGDVVQCRMQDQNGTLSALFEYGLELSPLAEWSPPGIGRDAPATAIASN